MANTPGNLPYPVGTDRVVDGDNAIRALAEALDPAWTTLPLESGWAVLATHQPPAYRRIAGVVYVTGAWLMRASAALVTNPGTWYTVATFPTGFRPSLRHAATGSVGVAGSLGAADFQILPTGELQFSPLVPGGSMATGGTIQNHVAISPHFFRVV